MAEALHIDRDKLILSPPEKKVPQRFWKMVERRKAGEPIAYITGRRAFWNIDLHVGPGVLVPRPDSEVLIASAIEHFDEGNGPPRVLDLEPDREPCCSPRSTSGPMPPGSGSMFRAAPCPTPSANARRLGFEGRLKLVQGIGPTGSSRQFDLILCNPPYIADGADLGPGVAEYEPDEALFAGKEGLDAYRAARAPASAPACARRSRGGRDRPGASRGGWAAPRQGWAQSARRRGPGRACSGHCC